MSFRNRQCSEVHQRTGVACNTHINTHTDGIPAWADDAPLLSPLDISVPHVQTNAWWEIFGHGVLNSCH